MSTDQSMNLFERIFFIFKIFGIWGGRTPSKYYKYYSFVFLFITFHSYNTFLTLSLIYTPRKMDLILREFIFYFTGIVVGAKVFMLIFMRDKIIKVLQIIDSDEFLGDYENKDGLLYTAHKNYKFGCNIFIVCGHIGYVSKLLAPFVIDLIRGTESELPISNYYFLTDENRKSYFMLWFTYQTFCIYGHMLYNIYTDCFMAGLLLVAIIQLRILNANLSNFKMSEEESKLPKELQEKILKAKLNSYLRQYDTVMKYYKTVQELIGTTIFIQFSVSSTLICVVMCGFLMNYSKATLGFQVTYLFIVLMQIFIPGYLGTQLSHESEEIVFAAYNAEWITRSQSFKKSLMLLMQRAKTPFKITGLNMFTLSVTTFTSIMKSAYSFFALIRNVQKE